MKDHYTNDNITEDLYLYVPINHAQSYLNSDDNLITFLHKLKIKYIQYCVSSFPGR